ncbi:MAG: hypothetical protein ACI8T1_000574 [Verrucomicrobiales bacterium]|jgi:hypothetical protein
MKPLPIITLLGITSVAAFGLGWMLKPASPAVVDSSMITEEGGSGLMPTQRKRSENGPTSKRAASPLGKFLPLNGVMSSPDMAGAMKAMASENDPLKKAAMFTALLEQLTPENAKVAFESLQENRGRGRGGRGGGDEMRLLLNAWGRIDGKTAIAELTAISEKERAEREANGDTGRGGRGGRGDGGTTFDIYSALSGWATKDSASALEYVNSLEGDDRQKSMYMSGIVRGLMVNSVDEAVDFISALPAGDAGRERYMGTVAEEMLEKGASSAAKWADGLKDDDLKGGAMDRIAGEFANEDLDGAVAWVSEHASEAYASRAVTEVAEEWAEKDPQAVIDWAADLPEETQKRVFEEALDEWTERDPGAASEYLAQMPDSPVKDSAVEGFAKELAREDPVSAATWAGTIGNEEIRTSTLTDVARNWLRSDRAAAEAWLPQSGLSAESQQAVLEPQRGGDRWGGGRGR